MNKLLEVAFSQYGVAEIPGDVDNPQILKYFHDIGQEWVKSESTAWCSAFLNWCCMKAVLPRSNKLNARSWLSVGYQVMSPVPGDIAVFWRESKDSWKGHVGVYINKYGEDVFVLGGNQNNTVCIKPYPYSRLLSYRRLV